MENVKEFFFSDDVAHEIAASDTGMYTAAQMAVYMGFSEIYLIGVDHHFRISQNNKGEIVIDNSVKDYFSEKYNTDKETLYIPNTEKSTQTYIAMKQHCDRRGVKVYNATRGGKLEVFPRINFDGKFDGTDKSYLVKLFKEGYTVIPSIDNINEINLLPDSNLYFLKPKESHDGMGTKKVNKDNLKDEFNNHYII